jgi:adenosylcobinamide hydrolase
VLLGFLGCLAGCSLLRWVLALAKSYARQARHRTRAIRWQTGVMATPVTSDAVWPSPELREIAPLEGARGPVLLWRFPQPLRSFSSAIVGGGIGIRHWVLNMTVDPLYSRFDPATHIDEVAMALNLSENGVGLMTAVDVGMHTIGESDGTVVCSTVGVRRPVWAFDANEALPQRETSLGSDALSSPKPGTINLVCFVEQRLCDAALVNAVATIAEAKTQALADRGIPGTGTASDAISILCPMDGDEEIFGGPRSYWGARLAAASYASVIAGIDRQRELDGKHA